jgi:hypothetical protein
VTEGEQQILPCLLHFVFFIAAMDSSSHSLPAAVSSSSEDDNALRAIDYTRGRLRLLDQVSCLPILLAHFSFLLLL